ncbi:unnamed protein product [Caenorhabditis nigoni]
MNLWILLIAVVTAQDLYHPQNFFRLTRDLNTRLSALSNPASLTSWRFIRNAGNDSLKTTVSSLKKVSRITNGIYLLQALTAGQIPPESLISELLHFGSVNPTQISKIDSSTIQKAVNDLKSFSEQSGSNPDIQKVETVFDGLEKILNEIDGIGDLNEWKNGKETFKTELTTLSTKGGDTALYLGMLVSAVNWNNDYLIVSADDSQATPQNFDTLKKELEKMKTSIEKLQKSAPPFKFNKVTSAMDGISPVLKAAKGVEMFRSVSDSIIMDNNEQSAYEEYIESFSKNVAGFDSHLTNFQTIIRLMSSRKLKSSKTQIAHTIGLPSGASDLSRMILDVNDPWIWKIVKTISLKTALKHFEQLGGLLETVNKALEFEDKEVDSFDQLLQLFQTVQTISAGIGTKKQEIAKGKQCPRPSADPIDLKNFPKFKHSLEDIDNKMGESVEKIEQLQSFFRSNGISELCEKVIKLCKEASIATDIKLSISNFVKNDDVKNLNVHIARIQVASTDITALWNPIKSSAENAINNFKELDGYQERLGHYSDYFKCLDDLELEDVFKTVAGLRKVRELKNDKKFSNALDNGMKVVEKVAGTKTDLENMKKTISGFKGLNASEFNGLEALKDASVHSKTIGMAVEGISNMEIALEKKNDVVVVEQSDLDVVENNKNKINDVTHLDSLLDLPPRITQMYGTLEKFKGSVLPFSESEILANQSGIFINAKSVSGVTGDFLKMRDSVEELKQVAPAEAAKLDKVKKALETMDSLELDFSGYQKSFDECKGSLEALDTFFMEYAKKNTPVTPPQGQNQQGNNPSGLQGSQGNSAKNEEEKSKLFMFIGITIGAIILLILGLHILLFIFARKKLKQIYPCFWPKPKVITDADKLLAMILKCIRGGIAAILETHELEKKVSANEAMFIYFLHLYTGDSSVCVTNKKLFMKEQEEDCTYLAPLLGTTRVVLSGYGTRFKNDYIHANVFILPNKKQLLLTQAPQAKQGKQNGTIIKFWWMAMQFEAKNIAMLCPMEDNGDNNYDKYFPQKAGESLKFEDLTLKCTSFTKECEGKLEVRVITGSFGNNKSFSVTHFCYPDWRWDTIPAVEPLLKVLDAVVNTDKPSIVHCGDGFLRTGAFAMSAYMTINLKQENKVDFREGLVALRGSRPGCLDNAENYAYSAQIFTEYTASKATLKNKELKGDYEYVRNGMNGLRIGQKELRNSEPARKLNKLIRKRNNLIMSKSSVSKYKKTSIAAEKKEKKTPVDGKSIPVSSEPFQQVAKGKNPLCDVAPPNVKPTSPPPPKKDPEPAVLVVNPAPIPTDTTSSSTTTTSTVSITGWMGEDVSKKWIDVVDFSKARREFKDVQLMDSVPLDKCKSWKANGSLNQPPSLEYPILDSNLVVFETTYCNMSLIDVTLPKPKIFVGQFPLKGTEEAFWERVFHQQITNMIVIVDEDCIEFFRIQKDQYIYHGKMFVNTRMVEAASEDVTRYVIEVLPEECSNSVMCSVTILKNWAPESVHGKQAVVMTEVMGLNSFLEKRPYENALVVSMHGAGRAGYFIALATAVHKLDKAAEPSIQEIVKALRAQRPKSVESLTQYVSLYTAIFFYIKKKTCKKNEDKKALMDCDEPMCKKTYQLSATFTKELAAEVKAATKPATTKK